MNMSGLLAKARGYLSGRPKLATDAVMHSRFDAMIHGELLEEAPALGQMAAELNNKYGFTDDLVRDTLMQFYQDSPRLRTKEEMAPSRLLNWAVSQSLAEAPETQEVRPRTRHDKYGAAMATIGVTSVVRRYLEQHKEIQEAAKEAEQAEAATEGALRELQDVAEQAEAAEQAQDEALNGYDGEGPLSEAQEAATQAVGAAAAALQGALARVGGAQQAQDAAGAAAGQLCRQAQQQLRESIRDAVRHAAEELRHEKELMFAWGVQDGDAAMMSIEDRLALARNLKGNEHSKFMALLGRFKLQQIALRANRVEYGRDEMYAVEMSGRLQDVVATELALARSHRLLRLDFLRRYASGQLLSRAYRGVEKVGKGAIICCVDTSSSMKATDKNGIPRITWAKAFPLSMLERARADGRDFVGIIFASANQQQVFRFPAGKGPIEQVLAFAAKDFNGGTNFDKPMDLAVDILEAEFNGTGRKKGDIVFITDDEYKLPAEWLARYLDRKSQLGFRVFGIAVGMKQAGGTLASMCDNVRAVQEFASPETVADIMQVV